MKKPSPSGEGSGGLGFVPLAPIPLATPPPGAGNEYEYVLNTDLNRADETEEGYIDQAGILGRNLHAPTIRPHEDGNMAAVAAVEETQPGILRGTCPQAIPRCPAILAVVVNLRVRPNWGGWTVLVGVIARNRSGWSVDATTRPNSVGS
jgi:hypothetical protein